VPTIVSVPHTRAWFLGVANIRGNLFSVVDFAGFLGQPATVMSGMTRLILFSTRAGDLNAGVVVQRVLGLRNLSELAPAAPPQEAPAWYAERWMDADGNAWQEIDLARLAHDPAFLQVGA
jgi:twitching motility protein PilI